MSDTLAAMERAREARMRGEYAEALRLHQTMHDAPLPPPEDRSAHSFRRFSLFEWDLLAREYPPARLAMQALRDRQAAQLDIHSEQRFEYIVELNRSLSDPQSTLRLFRHLEARDPGVAKRIFFFAADVLLDCGAVDILQRYLPEPQEGTHYRAQYLNKVVRNCSMQRRCGETLAFVGDLQLQCGVLELLGKTSEAEALTAMAVSLIESEETRALVSRELAEPGTISAILADHWRDARCAED